MFIDIDGTLTNKEKEITNYTKNVLKKATDNGIYAIVCSGRPNIYTVEKSQLSNSSNIVISDNGALIYDYINNKKIYEKPIGKETLKKVFDFAIENNVGCAFNSVSKRYKTQNCDKKAIIINSIDEIEENVTQIVLDTKVYEQIDFVKNWIEESGLLEICNCSSSVLTRKRDADEYEFDVTLKGVNKGKAMQKIMNYLNIDKSNSICFGDHINDYPMFEAANYKVAMQNGMKELKERADFIALNNYEDGLAIFIEEYIL